MPRARRDRAARLVEAAAHLREAQEDDEDTRAGDEHRQRTPRAGERGDRRRHAEDAAADHAVDNGRRQAPAAHGANQRWLTHGLEVILSSDIVSEFQEHRAAKEAPAEDARARVVEAGIGSRVEARSWIHAGRVTVNGKVIRNPDHWIDMQRDRVRFDDQPLEAGAALRAALQAHGLSDHLQGSRGSAHGPRLDCRRRNVSVAGRTTGPRYVRLMAMTNDNRFASV